MIYISIILNDTDGFEMPAKSLRGAPPPGWCWWQVFRALLQTVWRRTPWLRVEGKGKEPGVLDEHLKIIEAVPLSKQKIWYWMGVKVSR